MTANRNRLPNASSLKFASAMAYEQDMRFDPKQEQLTTTRLLAAMPAIVGHLLVHRKSVDRDFEQLAASGSRREVGNLPVASYPVGFCRHIRDLVWARAWADPGFQALVGPGVIVRRVFILLKGQYLQNAVQMGNLYVDVANDTVWVNKPKLEWALVTAVPYENVETWAAFSEVARRYFKVELYPSLLFPLAFPASPFFAIERSGRIGLLFAQDALFLKDLGEGMPRTQALLADDALMSRRLPAVYEDLLRDACHDGTRAAFPLTLAPTEQRTKVEGIVADFVRLGEQPAEQARITIDRYLRVISKATQQLTQLNLVPKASELDQLRAAGAIPPLD